MSCTVCGSNVPCGCNVQRDRSCCQNVVQAAPVPFYNCAPSCVESHGQNVTLQSFSADVKLLDTWNIPACGQTATINTESLRSIVVGSYLWNPAYGYFEITAFNEGTGQVTLTNLCTVRNAAAGTNVPSCTEFTVTVPPCACSDATQVCVAIDFTAPALNTPTDITLTSTQGLAASDTVQIGTGFYFVQAIKPNNIITIVNQGEGITPGTPVIARDANNNYQYCLSIVSTNPCDRTAQKEVGALLGCGASEVTVPLHYMGAGWVATQVRDNDNSAAYRPLGADDASCTTLSAILTLTNGVSTYNNVLVTSSAGFIIGDILEIEGGVGFRFNVTGIPDGTHINVTVSPTPSGTVTFPNGSVICLENCCQRLQTEINSIVANLGNYTHEELINDNGGHTINTTGGSTSYSTAHLMWTVTNPSSLKTLSVTSFLNLNAEQFVSGDNISSTYLSVTDQINLKVNGGATEIQSIARTSTFLDPADSFDQDDNQTLLNKTNIAPSGSATFETWVTFSVLTQPAGGGGICFIGEIIFDVNQIGVLV